MIGVAVDVLGVLLGTLIGMGLGKGINERMNITLMQGMGMAAMLIGAKMAVTADDDLIVIVSIVIGGVIGELCHLEERLNQMGDWLKSRFSIKDENFINAFMTASLLFCVGAMSIVGAIEAGLSGNNEILFIKTILDFVTAVVLSSSLGIGVAFSAILVLGFQGSIAILAGMMQYILVDAVIAYMSAVGGVLIIGVGLTVAGIKKINVTNLLPSVFVAGIIGYFTMMI